MNSPEFEADMSGSTALVALIQGRQVLLLSDEVGMFYHPRFVDEVAMFYHPRFKRLRYHNKRQATTRMRTNYLTTSTTFLV